MAGTAGPPSGANPSNIAGENIETEDDVLYLRVLPHFNKKLSLRDSELLISYLTVPYLRIPLLMRFFASPERLSSLSDPLLQEASGTL